jgi:multimeric flavodoxin WrbA
MFNMKEGAEMSNNIVVLSGSPRKDGNTDKLAAAFIEGAKEAGKAVIAFRAADMKIGGCLGCNHCFEEKGVCVQKDEMLQILDALRYADAIVFASPVYYFAVTAQLKLAIDRTYALISDKAPIKRSALLITCGDNKHEAADGAVVMYNNIRSYSKWDDAGVIIATGLHEKNDIAGRAELEKAQALGSAI